MANVDTPDDQMIAVNYGDYESDDWAAKHQISLSELASRLNSKHHFDNRGRLIWSDGAEEAVLQWNLLLVGAGAVSRSTVAVWRGAASALLSTPAVGPTGAGIWKRFYNPQTGRYGAEIAWSSALTAPNYLDLSIVVRDGVNRYTATLRLAIRGGLVQYNNAAGGWTNIPIPLCYIQDLHYWHKMKLVIDVDNLEYVRVLVDGYEYDMTGIPFHTVLDASCACLVCQCYMPGDGANVLNVYLDDFIYTHLEP